jgi:8-oxo-dGTP pyrophosphatase MutT (NUDIX family)
MQEKTDAELSDDQPPPSPVKHPFLRPRDAATLLLLDRGNRDVRVLMGRRHMRHAFFPGALVFPGGRTDPADSRIPVAEGLLPDEERKLAQVGSRTSTARARAIALSAIRETYEETGILIGRKGRFGRRAAGWDGFAEQGVQPALSGLRFVARAITPPGRIRRFDTRFLACWHDEVAAKLPGGGPTDELGELVWLTLDDALAQAQLPVVTRRVLQQIRSRLGDDPELKPGGPVAFFRTIRNQFVQDTL